MKHILDGLGRLPVLPVVVQEVIRSLGDPDVDALALGHRIGKDPVLGARLLRVANSAFYGLSRQVATPHDAIMVMGLGQVRALVLASGLAHALPTHAHGPDRRKHWQRSFRVATSAQALARRSHGAAEPAFTAGMLHNIGELVLDACLPEAYAAARKASLSQGIPLRQAERAALGFDHTEAGAEVARHWKLPDAIEHAIRHCHDPEAAASDGVSACVAMACLLDDHAAAGGEGLPPDLPGALRSALPLDDATLAACIPDAAEADAAASLLLGD
ncbi:MAG: HDOD domain-containing protein [Candidatus Nitricoxidivorans perseverans]|uniref:HDOD domain-containing protein n=1 Tax=Candidatus Nitricoxidivorans perseverans TaxID=2975601 RepID=A0AA49FKF8_9PROT|nr:MAG: HDOD domain-containing protein [Candidatus Nitricoxidivorans perseverans]